MHPPDRLSRRNLAFGLAALPLAGAAAAVVETAVAAQRPLTVFAAASLKDALDQVIARYEAGGARPVRASYGASSVIARQIEQGAPADVFISADREWMDYLAARELIRAGARRDLLGNRLVLVAPATSRARLAIRPGMPIGRALGGGRLAVAGPEVPAGRYARAALEALGVWTQVEGRLAPADNVRTALQFVARGETPLGVVYATDAAIEPKVRVVGTFPANLHPPIVYPAAATAASGHADSAGFLRYLAGPDAGRIFRRYGFTTL